MGYYTHDLSKGYSLCIRPGTFDGAFIREENTAVDIPLPGEVIRQWVVDVIRTSRIQATEQETDEEILRSVGVY